MSEKRVSQPADRYQGDDSSSTWNECEKQMLLTGLKRYGHTDVQNIAKLVPSKSQSAIKLMISNTMMAARRSIKECRKSPIDMWLEQANLDQTNSLIPRALAFISMFERHPTPESCGGCDLRAVYDYIYRITRGHPAVELPTKTRKIIYKVISKTVSKMRLRSTENLVQFTHNLYKSTPGRDYTRKTTMPQKIGPSKVLHELNTFSVPSDQLRMSEFN